MDIDNIDLLAYNGSTSINLSFNDPAAANPYQMKNLYGLDAEDIGMKYIGYDPSGNHLHHALYLRKREVVMRIQLNPDFSFQSYSELRDDVYRLISGGRTGKLTLNFKSGTTVLAEISGFVTKVEVPITTETPELQVTMVCPDPKLKAPTYTSVDPGVGQSFQIIDNESTAPHGIRFSMTWTAVSGHTPAFRIGDLASGGDWEFRIHMGNVFGDGLYGFQIGDQFELSSIENERYCNLIRGGTTYPIADFIQPNAFWPLVYPGTNDFHVSCSAAGVRWTWNSFEHKVSYWGV